MKKFVPFLVITCFISLGGYAQRNNNRQLKSTMDTTRLMADSGNGEELVVVSYHVEERINMMFGTHSTTYEVSDLNKISKNDLGPDNVRIITPRYAKVKTKTSPLTLPTASVALSVEQPKAAVDVPNIRSINTSVVNTKTANASIVNANPAAPEEKAPYVEINITDTYERILKKGYGTVDMLKRVANTRFFDGDLVTAERWYCELFAMTDDFEDVLYYRYAQSLIAVNDLKKADEMMAIFQSRNSK